MRCIRWHVDVAVPQWWTCPLLLVPEVHPNDTFHHSVCSLLAVLPWGILSMCVIQVCGELHQSEQRHRVHSAVCWLQEVNYWTETMKYKTSRSLRCRHNSHQTIFQLTIYSLKYEVKMTNTHHKFSETKVESCLACFVWPTVQNLKKFNLQWKQTEKSPQNCEAETTK